MTGPRPPGERVARPLQPVALGLVVVALSVRLGGYDVLADPVGWVLVLLGTVLLPAEVARRGVLIGLAGLALVVAVPLWHPDVAAGVLAADRSLTWALSLPQLAFTGLLCHVLAGRAAVAGDRGPARWFRLAVGTIAAVAAAPVLVFGAGWEQLAATAYVVGALTLLVVISLLLAWRGRPWAGVVARSGRSGESPARDRSGP